MKRAGFTMIELIFVIVILGILAAVALPKFAGVSDQANAQKCNAFVGTLNRTIGPSMWSTRIADSNGTAGNVNATTFPGTTAANSLSTYMALADIPMACLSATPGATATETIIFNTNDGADVTFGAATYELNQVAEGNLSDSPRWAWVKK